MTTTLTDVLSDCLAFLSEANDTLTMKKDIVPEQNELELFTYLISDLSFQVDFCLINSVTQIQEIYDGYRNKPAEESNIQIRTLLNLATHIYTKVQDADANGWDQLIARLGKILTLHSKVDPRLTCQDESILECMSYDSWKVTLTNNPWLVAAVCIQQIPSYYILKLVSGTSEEVVDET